MIESVNPIDFQLRDGVAPGDASAIESLVRACNVFREDEIDVALELVHDALARGPQSEYLFLVATSGNRVIGYACYRKIGCTVGSYDICWVAVDPNARRVGVARRLLAETEERIRLLGGWRAYIETSSMPEYEAARRFYESSGYEIECVQSDFYAPGDDKITLRKIFL